MHWPNEQVSVNSGVLKTITQKSYNPYISDDKKHYQHFVKICIKNMLNEVDDVSIYPNIIVESCNCDNQYNSCSHFFGMQQLADRYNIPITRVWGIAGHVTREVYRIDGLAKTAIRREVANEESFYSAKDIAEC